MAPDTIEREITIAAPVERVWTILTQAEHIGSWFADAGAEIDLRPGGAMVDALGRARHHAGPRRGGRAAAPLRLPLDLASRGGGRGAGRGQLDAGRVHAHPRGGRHPPARARERVRLARDHRRAGRPQHEDNVGGWKQMLSQASEYAERVAA